MPLHSPFIGLNRPHFLPEKLRLFVAGSFFIEAALAFLFISTPVYIFQIASTHFDLQNWGLHSVSAGLIGVCLFYLLQRVGCLLFLPVSLETIRRQGFAPALSIGAIVYILKFSSFLLFANHPWVLFLTALLSGYGLIVYWVSYSTILAADLVAAKAGKEVGSIEFLTRLAQVIAPLLGTLLQARFGFSAPLLVSIILFLAGILCFLQIPNLKTKAVWSLQQYWSWIQSRNILSLNIAMASFQWERMGASIFWPVFLFITFQRLEAVGYILSGATFLALMFVYITGWLFDSTQHKNSLRLLTGAVTSLLWLPRLIFLQSPFVLVINDAVDRIVKGMYSTIFFALTLLRARREKIFIFMVHREVTFSLVTIGLMLLLIALILLQLSWEWLFATFIIASFLSLLFPLTAKKNDREV